jgi:hypothetical protein
MGEYKVKVKCMPLKIFVSSEMKTESDKERRKAAIDEIMELGHIPVVFEDWPARPLPEGSNLIEFCKEKVATSDIFFIVVDDIVSKAIDAEHEAALENIGPNKMFYYFTKSIKRDDRVKQLWSYAKNGYIAKEVSDAIELRQEIKRSIASYIEDALKKEKKISEIIFDESLDLEPDEEWHQEFRLEKGDVITITCIADEKFYAGFFSREEYIQRRGGGGLGMFDFTYGTDMPQCTAKIAIQEGDDYYLVIRVGVWSDEAEIYVKVRCDRNGKN